MKTILLDTIAWDLVLDVKGNIALASDPYSKAQDAASAIRTFLGEEWYNTTDGVPYQNILNLGPNPAYIRAKLEAAALTVPGVVMASVFLTSLQNRAIGGQVQVTDSSGTTTAAHF